MAQNPNNFNIIKSSKAVIKEEVNLQFLFYLLSFFSVYLLSYLIPGILITLYYLLLFVPFFLEAKSFLEIFTKIEPLTVLIFTPFIIVISYLIRIFIIALITKIVWRYTEKISPTKDGIIPRNIPSKTLDMYHIRSFLIKFPSNTFKKGLFPWLINWLYNFIGSNNIGKGTTIEEQFGADRYVQTGKNCYIGVNSGFSSHAVDGIFGNISYFQIKLGDNVTTAALNCIAPGVQIGDNSSLFPMAGATKFNILKGDNYYFGVPLRKIFKKKITEYSKIPKEIFDEEVNYRKNRERLNILKETIGDISENKDINEIRNEIKEKEKQEPIITEDNDDNLFELDFTTSSAISKISLKYLILYTPIFFFSGLLVAAFWYDLNRNLEFFNVQYLLIVLSPIIFFTMYFIFISGCVFFSKLFLILINLIHKPKEGVFRAEEGDKDFEFWRLRTELKKIVLWLLSNFPLPWINAWAFRWFGVKMDFTSHMPDAWIDCEFLKFGRKVIVGQGAVVMSSFVVGKYLIIKESFFDDYAVIGGVSTVAPGTIVGKDTVLGAFSVTNYNQVLDSGWIYFGIPVIKLKPNKYAEMRRDIIIKKDVDQETKYEETYEVNIDKDKNHLA